MAAMFVAALCISCKKNATHARKIVMNRRVMYSTGTGGDKYGDKLMGLAKQMVAILKGVTESADEKLKMLVEIPGLD